MTRLAGLLAIFLLALSWPAGDAVAVPPERSVVVVTTDEIRFVALAGGADDICLCEIYEAEFEVLRTLDGPRLGRRVRIRFISHALVRRPPNFLAVMNVDRNGENLYADNWMRVTRDTCLVRSERGWSEAEPDARGHRPDCTPVSTLVRPYEL